MARSPQLGTYIIVQCDGTGEQPLRVGGDQLGAFGICRKCERPIMLRADGTIRFHGKREEKRGS